MEADKEKELQERLERIAEDTAWSDDEEFQVDDYAVEHLDDAYWGGQSDGEINLARDLLKDFFGKE